MGQRVSISKIKDDTEYTIFEANNYLPFFWIFLLDYNTVWYNKEKVLESFYNENRDYYVCIKLNNKILTQNIKLGLEYFEINDTNDLKPKFKEFSDYILKITANDSIYLDIFSLCEFKGAEIFIEYLLNTLKKIENKEIVKEVQYCENNKHNFFGLVGYDDYSDVEYNFQNFSKEYEKLQIDEHKRLEKEKEKFLKESEKEKKRVKRDVIYGGLGSLFVVGISIAMIIIDGISFLAIISLIMGLLGLLFFFLLKE